MSKRVLVTGAAGFIGSNLCRSLSQRGDLVYACDYFGVGDKWKNLHDALIYDFVSPCDLGGALETFHFDSILHMGAISSTTETDVDALIESNVTLTRRLWHYAAEHQVPFVYASSAAVYGDGSLGFSDEGGLDEMSGLRPLNPYGWSKLAVDRSFTLAQAHGLKEPPFWAGLRFFNVYGPREEHKAGMRSVASQIIPKIARGDSVALFKSHHPSYSDGGQLRDFIHVDDCIRVINWLLEGSALSGIYNVGTGVPRSFYDVARICHESLNQPEKVEYIDTPEAIRAKYQYFTKADMEKLKGLGYEHDFMTLEEGLNLYTRSWLELYG